MTNKRRKHADEFKAKVVLEALREEMTLSELGVKYNIHSQVITTWKSEFMKNAVFAINPNKQAKEYKKKLQEAEKEKDHLYKQIGKLTAQNEWAKKNLRNTALDFKKTIVKKDDNISMVQQCDILELNRSSLYFKSKPKFTEEDFRIMNEMQDISIKYPFYGHRTIWKELPGNDFCIGRDRVLNFMRFPGIKPIYPAPKTTIVNKEHQVYPYLLRELEIRRSNQVWATDITYLPTENGFCYMVAVIDWYSRAILSYRISNSMDKSFCIEALKDALDKYGKPEIFNTDQGCQFTSKDFLKILENKNVKISMDGKGRALDNIIIERFWRSLKYEDIKIRDYRNIKEIKEGVKKYIEFYNHKRRHSTLGYITPFQEYLKGEKLKAA